MDGASLWVKGGREVEVRGREPGLRGGASRVGGGSTPAGAHISVKGSIGGPVLRRAGSGTLFSTSFLQLGHPTPILVMVNKSNLLT